MELAEWFQNIVFLNGNFRNSEIVSAKEIAKKFAKVGRYGELVPGEDPPDFVFIDKKSQERWAIEETQLHEYIERNGKITSIESVFQPLKKLCADLSSEVKLARNYIITFDTPIIKMPILRERIVEYIQSWKKEATVLDSEKRVEIEGFEG